MKQKLKITYNAPVTLTFVLLCLLATFLGVISEGNITKMFFSTYKRPLTDIYMYPRLLTHVLGHSGWKHFLGNATYLLLLGPMLEEKYGSNILLKVILITALITGAFNNIIFPRVMLCGASGVVFAFIVLASWTKFRQYEVPLSVILVLIFYIGQQIVGGIMITDNISNTSHIIGGFIGAIIGYHFNKR